MIEARGSEFPGQGAANRRTWDAIAGWWDDTIGDGNDFQDRLIEPATESLLAIRRGEVVLDIACGAGRFTRRMAGLGATVITFDQSEAFIERARTRTPDGAGIEYRVVDSTDADALLRLGEGRFDKAVCTMALMDMPEIVPLFSFLRRLLKPGGIFVFSITHPCFHSAGAQPFCETIEAESGRPLLRTGVKVSSYRKPFARKTEGIPGQPEPHDRYHRSMEVLFGVGFDAGFVVDGILEPGFPSAEGMTAGIRWENMPDIPPVMVVRMRR
ncbi:MAG: class I SAM-dependent methyltransferase [Planctomycetes bacterium]|nr:class I SAM-dependent methyltransferase [Planctomycetota bacterium]